MDFRKLAQRVVNLATGQLECPTIQHISTANRPSQALVQQHIRLNDGQDFPSFNTDGARDDNKLYNVNATLTAFDPSDHRLVTV